MWRDQLRLSEKYRQIQLLLSTTWNCDPLPCASGVRSFEFVSVSRVTEIAIMKTYFLVSCSFLIFDTPQKRPYSVVQVHYVNVHGKRLAWPITVAERSKVGTIFARSNAGIVGSNPTEGMDVCVPLFCVDAVLCVGRGLATG
jgi:hypothetical protein